MSRFIKYHPDSEMSKFLESKPNANHLAQIIAKRARRTKCEYTGLDVGQCLLGDFRKIGLTEKQYRTAKNTLKKIKFAAFQGTNKGTVATLVSIEVWDINADEKGGQGDRTRATNKNDKNTTTTIEENFEEQKPYDIDEARNGIERIFGNPQIQVKNIQAEYKNQTGFQVDEIKVQIAVASFLQKGMTENYKGRIKDDYQLKSKLLSWVTNQKKFDYTESFIKKSKEEQKPELTLMQHIEENYKSSEVKIFKLQGFIDKWEKKYTQEEFRFKNEAKAFKNKNITPTFLFDLCYLPYGKNIGGMRPEAKLDTFKRFFNSQSSYNQNKGEIRELFKKWSKTEA